MTAVPVPLSCLSRRVLRLLGEYTMDACIASGAIFGFMPPAIVKRAYHIRPVWDDTASPSQADSCRRPGNQAGPAGAEIQDHGDHLSGRARPPIQLSRAERRQWDKLIKQLH